MPIGTGKAGLFGGIAIEAGSETFNAPGTFSVPTALKTVQLCGNGSTANAGNPGNPGGDGIGGDGGDAYCMPTFYLPACATTREEPSNTPGTFSYAAVQGAQGGPGSAAGTYCPLINPPGGPGNPGNPGGVTSVFCYCWTGGAAGTGGTGGVDGDYGVPGGGGNFHGGPYTPLSAHQQCQYTMRNNNQIAPGGAGLAAGGRGGGYAWNKVGTFQPYCCSTIRWSLTSVRGGGGGGGGGIIPCASCGGEGTIAYVNPINGTPAGSDGSGFGGTTSGGSGGGGSGVNTGMGNAQVNHISIPGAPAGAARAGAGGGGAGSYGASFTSPPGCPNSPAPAEFSTGNGGGGGGSGSVGNPGSGAGNPGSAGTPATFNCVPVTTGCYPVQVGTGGQIVISWNDQ